MIEGKSWHGDPKKDFRPVHYALFQAVKKKLKVALIISENLTGFALLDRQKDLINSIGTLNGRRVKKAKKAVGKKIIETVKAVGQVVKTVDQVVKTCLTSAPMEQISGIA